MKIIFNFEFLMFNEGETGILNCECSNKNKEKMLVSAISAALGPKAWARDIILFHSELNTQN